MAAVKFEKLPEFIRLNNLLSWVIQSDRDANSAIFRTSTDKDLDGNLDYMNKVMSMTSGVHFYFRGKDSVTDKLSNGFMSCEIVRDADIVPQTAQTAVAGIGTVTMDELHKQIALSEERASKTAELKYLEKELERRTQRLDEQEREFNTLRNSGLDFALARIGEFLPRRENNVRMVAGIPAITQDKIPSAANNENDNNIGEVENTVADLLARWSAVDADWLFLLSKIVGIAENEPGKYNMAKSFL